MARKLDAKAIEANRIKRQPDHSSRERAKELVRAGAEENQKHHRTREIKPEPKVLPEEMKKILVAAYCRVSTAEEQQAGSFEAQLQHFKQVIESNGEWEMAGIFSDEGISGTSLDRRKGFQQMIEAAKNDKIDLILVKSISRFGRNVVDVLANLRLLNGLSSPVTVNFEQEGLLTSDGRNSLLISILSAVAELESQQKSEAIRWGIRYRMEKGIFKFAVKNTLGYYRDHFGRIKVEPAEAEIVKYIYESYLDGASSTAIADALTQMEISTPTGLFVWRSGTVRGILSNEKYNGSALMQKTVTTDFLSHRQIKNHNIISKYLSENHHESIIPMAQWEQVQEELRKRRDYGKSGTSMNFIKKFFAPRIKSGYLKGYFLIDCDWNTAERESFLKIIDSIQNLDEER